MKKILHQLFIILLLISTIDTSAQSFSKLKDKKGDNPFEDDIFKIYGRYTSVNSEFTEDYSGITFNVGLRSDKYEKGEIRTRYENPTLGDFIYALINISSKVKDGVLEKQKYDDHAHGGGFLGWFQAYMNVVSKDKLLISPGITLGDYIYGSTYDRQPGGRQKYDPYGYYLAGGPAIMVSILPTNKIWIDGYINYDIAFLKVKNDSVDPNYQKPAFLTVGADLNTTSKLFGGIRLNKLMNSGPNKDASSRIDVSVGFCF
ncbi:hypothetical protein A5893_01795 [Pedobacter psychrophilus]|uniref:Outer membrane protein beta-barrel domain-containing protein n=1 Tax=Pedobacter psychrophilus TaxID=1826909 RepID=A0A179DL97_9SPHI|nr:hypothetical protein [Pedobacter psychrophilus]OAQ41876.1 hypothetical protein A5893_01795 [Pedobacter psychrophilus]